MARKSKTRRVQRTTERESLESLIGTIVPATAPRDPLRPTVAPLREVEDRRTYHPDPVRPLKSLAGRVARLGFIGPARPARGTLQRFKARQGTLTLPGARFPRQTVVCVRRQQRKEVLHALAKAGKSGTSRKRHRRNETSTVICRRK